GRGENQVTLQAIHTPGHSPGSTCFYVPDMNGGVLFAGDTLFAGGPGATGRSYSDFHTIIASIRTSCSPCPARPGYCPGTGRPPPSARSSRTCRSGSTAATEAGCQPPHPPYPPGRPPHPPGQLPHPFGRTQRKVRFSTADPYLTLRSAPGGWGYSV